MSAAISLSMSRVVLLINKHKNLKQVSKTQARPDSEIWGNQVRAKGEKSQRVLSFFLFSLFSLCCVNFSVKNRKLVSCNRLTCVSILLIRKFLQIKPTQHSTLKFGEPRLGQKERESQRVLSFALFSLFSLCCVNFSMKNRKLVSCN